MDSSLVNPPLICVITVVYNGVSTIERTIKSIIGQTFLNIEYIVIDGGSSDGTNDVIKKYESRINYSISEPDLGIYDAMNKGILKSTGEWIIFMNSGDVFSSENVLFDLSIKIMISNAHIIYGNTIIKENNIVIIPPNKIRKSFFLLETICHQSVFFNRSVFDIIGLYNLKYKILADREVLLKAIIAKMSFMYVNVEVCVWESVGFSLNNLNLFKIEELDLKNTYFSYIEQIMIRIYKKLSNYIINLA